MAAKNYTINFVDPTKSTINVLPSLITGPSGSNRQTDIDLIGMGHSLWGEVMLENILHILENFSSEEDIHTISAVTSNTFTVSGDVTLAFPTNRTFNIWGTATDDGSYTVESSVYVGAPTYETTVTVGGSPGLVGGSPLGFAGELGVPNKANTFSATTPIQGQMWYNQTRGQMYVYELTGSPQGNWKRSGGITISDTEPTAPSNGDLWWETATYAIATSEYGRNLQIYIGGSWVRVAEDYLPRDGSKAMTGQLNMGLNYIRYVAAPTSSEHVGDRGYNDGRYVINTGDTMTGQLTMSGVAQIDMGNNRILNLANATLGGDAVSRNFGDGRYLELDGTNTMSATMDLGNQYITNVLDPTSDTHVGDRGYNDSRYVNVTGDTMSSPLTIDTGTNTTLLVLNNSAGNESYLRITNSDTGPAGTGTNGAFVGIDSSENVWFGNHENTSTYFSTNGLVRMSINSSGVTNFSTTPTVSGSNIWHAGNDGSLSGLDADTVDGLHASSFIQSSKVHYSQLRHGLNQSFGNHASATYILPPTTGFYLVYAYGITANRGNDAATIQGPQLYYGTTSSSAPIYTTLLANDIGINWPDGNAPISCASVIYLTSGNYWRILFDTSYWAVDYTAVRLDHV